MAFPPLSQVNIIKRKKIKSVEKVNKEIMKMESQAGKEGNENMKKE